VVRVPGYRSRGPGFDSRRYQIFWEVVGLERGPLSLVSTVEELLGRNTSSSGFGLENREYGRGDPLHWPHDTLYSQKLALTSPTIGGRSVSIVPLRIKAAEFFFYVSGHYPTSCFYISKHNVSETVFCLRLQVEPTQLSPIDRASPYLRNIMFWNINRTVKKRKVFCVLN
jgi:hypothetical protein